MIPKRRVREVLTATFLLGNIVLWAPASGVGGLPARNTLPGEGALAGPPVYLVARAEGEAIDSYKAKSLSKTLVQNLQGGLASSDLSPSDRAQFVDEEYDRIKQCPDTTHNCEVIQIVREPEAARVVYEIHSIQIPVVPGKRHPNIWPDAEPPSCDVSADRPEKECDTRMMRTLASKVLAHDGAVHGVNQ